MHRTLAKILGHAVKTPPRAKATIVATAGSRFTWTLISIALIGSPSRANTLVDLAMGTRMAISSAQNMLARPPLPSLEATKKTQIPITVEYVTGSESNSVYFSQAVNDNPAGTASNAGNYTGGILGVGYVSASPSNWNMFGEVLASQLSGSMTMTDTAGNQFDSSTATTTSRTGLLGVAYRALGDAASHFALGFFGAAVALNFSSELDIPSQFISTQSSGLLYGPLVGVQFSIRFGPFVINPYDLYFYDASSPDRTIDSGNGSPIVQSLPGSFNALGFNLGFKTFRLNVYTSVSANPAISGTSVQNYGLSYSIQFGKDN